MLELIDEPTYRHVLLNHLPVTGLAISLVVLLTGAILRHPVVIRVGLALVALRLWANCSGPVLLLLGLCMVTNSYLYSFSGALIASSLFNPKPAKAPGRLPAFQPALQHA